MKPARVHKIKIRENVLRQMLFTDKNIILIIIAGITGLVWLLGRKLPTQAKVFIGICLSGLTLLGLSSKIDRQPAYRVLKRMILFAFNKRNVRF